MIMADFENQDIKHGLSVKLWRGERMCLLGFDVVSAEPDLVGFAIECRSPGATEFFPLLNRITFPGQAAAQGGVTGARKFPSTLAPFQKFRWVHFPHDPRAGQYTYRATKMHMPAVNILKKGTQIELDISLDPVTYHDFLDVGFTRNFASSQAFVEKFPGIADIDAVGKRIIPASADKGLSFTKMSGNIYTWLGFEAFALIMGLLAQAVKDPTIHLDVLAYDFNEPDLLAHLEKLGPRLRAIIDDSVEVKDGVARGHGVPRSAESQAARRLRVTAGGAQVKRMHFKNLQHHKVFIAKRNGKPFKVLAGSTNFSFRGIYIQANNVLVFDDPEIAGLYGKVFDAVFHDPARFSGDDLAGTWHLVQAAGKPPIHFCFSPHKSADLSLNPLRGAIDQASSSVLYSVAFLNQIKSGPTKEAFDRLMKRPVFSYGVSDKAGALEVRKPDGTIGLVDFAFLAKTAPEPFKSEWSGGKGINVHHKFVVTDFSLPTAKVFTGSSNLAPSGEKNNGDHLIMIEDRRIATGYAIEALRVFDHLHFRSRMKKAASNTKETLALRLPRAISGKPAWFEPYYVPHSQKQRDRELFAR
jgi:phosphatidylserine/phosphatidylglycerophosphate/cardiolipin synthase-like enzyme